MTPTSLLFLHEIDHCTAFGPCTTRHMTPTRLCRAIIVCKGGLKEPVSSGMGLQAPSLEALSNKELSLWKYAPMPCCVALWV